MKNIATLVTTSESVRADFKPCSAGKEKIMSEALVEIFCKTDSFTMELTEDDFLYPMGYTYMSDVMLDTDETVHSVDFCLKRPLKRIHSGAVVNITMHGEHMKDLQVYSTMVGIPVGKDGNQIGSDVMFKYSFKSLALRRAEANMARSMQGQGMPRGFGR